MEHDGLERGGKEAPGGALQRLDEIGHVQQVLRAAEARGLGPAEMVLFRG
jgi:hypothetical protein